MGSDCDKWACQPGSDAAEAGGQITNEGQQAASTPNSNLEAGALAASSGIPWPREGLARVVCDWLERSYAGLHCPSRPSLRTHHRRTNKPAAVPAVLPLVVGANGCYQCSGSPARLVRNSLAIDMGPSAYRVRCIADLRTTTKITCSRGRVSNKAGNGEGRPALITLWFRWAE